MAKLNLSIKNVEVQQGKTFETLPDGRYSVVVAKADVKESKAGGHYINFGYQVVDGDHKGAMVFDIVNINHSNPEVVRIGMERLATVAWATGHTKDTVEDSDELINKLPFEVSVKTEEKDGYKNLRVKSIVRTAPLEEKKTDTKATVKKPWNK